MIITCLSVYSGISYRFFFVIYENDSNVYNIIYLFSYLKILTIIKN